MAKGVVEISDRRYPPLLKKIEAPPAKIYCKGKWDKYIFEKCLAVVGSRRMTTYGRQATDKLVSEVAAQGVTIVSGFMYGVDAQAHRAALEAGGRTIAVMPCGIDVIHPGHQEKLYEEILNNGGLVISEIEGNFLPKLWTYPMRNRIVAGLCQATLVIEAAYKSGSLITADFARRFGRKLFAAPGPITSSLSEGTLQLIKEGAGMAATAGDILKEYGIVCAESSEKMHPSSVLSEMEISIVEKLKEEPIAIDPLSRAVKVFTSDLGATLSLMQLKGLICKEGNKYYAKCNCSRNDI